MSCSAPAGGDLHLGSLQHRRLLPTNGSSNWELCVWIKGNRGHLLRFPCSAIRQHSDRWDQDLGDVSLPHISSLFQAHCSTHIQSIFRGKDGPCGKVRSNVMEKGGKIWICNSFFLSPHLTFLQLTLSVGILKGEACNFLATSGITKITIFPDIYKEKMWALLAHAKLTCMMINY